MSSLQIDPLKSALVLIDLQKGIVGNQTFPHPSDQVVANAARLADAFRAKGGLVVLVHVTFLGEKDRLTQPADESAPMGQIPADWAEIMPELGPKEGDLVIVKRQWGAFYGTELDLQLRRRGIDTIVLGGIATNFGVESTARDAYERGYTQVFVEDAMSNRNAEGHVHTFTRVFPRIGKVRSTEEVLAAL